MIDLRDAERIRSYSLYFEEHDRADDVHVRLIFGTDGEMFVEVTYSSNADYSGGKLTFETIKPANFSKHSFGGTSLVSLVVDQLKKILPPSN